MALNTKEYRRPLVVYVAWHPESAEGKQMAERVYAHLCHDVESSSERGLGIPVFFRSAAADAETNLPLPVPLDDDDRETAQRTATFVLVDNTMLLDRKAWGTYINEIRKKCGEDQSRHRLFVLGLTSLAYKLNEEMAEFQLISLPQENRTQFVLNRVTHELCRMLYDRGTLEADETAHLPDRSVGVFLSHAKRDGLEIAESIRDYIGRNLSLRSFFDARDILPGKRWKEVLKDQASSCAVLAIQTDVYASREWCQFEVLEAKRAGVPIVAVNAVESGEARSFPYLGNIPTVRWQPQQDNPFEEVLGSLFLEILRGAYFPQKVESLRKLYNLKGEFRPMPHAPELLTALEFDARSTSKRTYVYPDPPLATGERELIRKLNPSLKLATPATLSTT